MIDSRRKREDVVALSSIPKRQRSTRANTAAKPISSPCTVMIAGLSNDCTVLELKSRLEIFGPISRIRIDAVDGCGHVTFRSDDAAETAISAARDPAFGITIRSKKRIHRFKRAAPKRAKGGHDRPVSFCLPSPPGSLFEPADEAEDSPVGDEEHERMMEQLNQYAKSFQHPDADATEVVEDDPEVGNGKEGASIDRSQGCARTLSISKGTRPLDILVNMSSAPKSTTLREVFSPIDEALAQGLDMLEKARQLFKQSHQRFKLVAECVASQLAETRRSLDESEARRVEAERLRAEAESGRVEAEVQRVKAEEKLAKERAIWKESDKRKSSMISQAYKLMGDQLKRSTGSCSHASCSSN